MHLVEVAFLVWLHIFWWLPTLLCLLITNALKSFGVCLYIYIYICMYIYIDRHRHGLLILLWLALQVSNLPIRAVVTFLLIKYLRLIHASTGMSMCTGTEPTILKLELGSLRKGHINVNFLLMHIHMISVN